MRQISKRTLLLIGVGTITALLLLLVDLLKSALAPSLSHLPLWIIAVGIVVVIVLATAVGLWYERLKSTPEALDAVASANRRRMLNRVRKKWISGFLENEIYYGKKLLPLPLCRRVGDPWDLELRDPLESAESLSLDTKISDVFDEADRRLLILGDPGAGKTTLMLELARDLLKRADNDESEKNHIPVVLMLSSWATKQLSLEKWIVEELQSEKYQVPSRIAQDWVEHSQLLLLLEGLEEIASDALPACIKAVNKYLAQANRSIVICSRTDEYLKYLKQRGEGDEGLHLRTAVSIQPLSFQQVEEYLSKQEGISGLKNALEQEQGKSLRALATTPLFLTVLILAYKGKSAEDLLPLIETASAKDQQHALFHTYVERVLQKDGSLLHATAQQTRHWLAWLAHQLTVHDQTELYLENLQPDWLPKRRRAFYQWSVVLFYGLFLMLFYGLFLVLYYGVVGQLDIGLVAWLIFVLLVGLVGGLRVGLKNKIEPAEALTWSWEEARSGLVGGLLVGLSLVLVGVLLGWLDPRLRVLLVGGLLVWLGGVLLVVLFIGLLGGLLYGLSSRQLSERRTLSPNEGIRRSVKNGLVGVLSVVLFFGLLVGLLSGLSGGLFLGLFFGLVCGLGGLFVVLFFGLQLGLGGVLFVGLAAAVQHYILRFWLWQARCTPAPWQYVAFLDDTVEQLLLRKVGGGYIFRHRLLQDYFASLDTPLSEEAPAAPASFQKPDEKE